MLVLPLVNKLSKEGDFLTSKIKEGIIKYKTEFDKRRIKEDSISKAASHPLIAEFLGPNTELMKQESYVE